jgi:tRNA A-37 threonylcarbamoyl transferase component Bud32
MQCPFCKTPVDPSQHFCPACGKGLASSEDAAQRDPLLGQTFGGKYTVVRLLGEGGMGAVYEGEQKLGATKRRVAIKTLHAHLSHDSKIKARFEREVGTVAELEHPNTIQVFDFGASADGILYIVMEFLQGKSLAATLEKDGAMAPARVEKIMKQICGSLAEAHGRGIVHRDLKPDNVVLVDRAGQKDFVKVLDFGIAKRSSEVDSGDQKLTQQGMVLGTPPYMSPEQFTGRPIDARSDIYSLGVMAYEMLTGRLPFHANTAWEWATQHMNQAPIPIESFPEGQAAPEPMRSVIERALAKSPDERFQTVSEFVDAFAGTPSDQRSAATHAEAAEARRQKTEMGAPLDVAAAFGGTGVRPAMGPAGPPRGHTPIASNVSFPTPGAIPQPPPREDSRRGKGRAMLLGLAGLISLASVGAIAFSLRGGWGGGSKEVVFDQGAPPAPATALVPSSVPVEQVSNSAGGGTDVPPLSTAGNRSAPRPAPVHAPPAPPAAASVVPGAVPAPVPLTPPPGPPKPSKYDGPECANARKLKLLGHPREAESWALACLAKGGIP